MPSGVYDRHPPRPLADRFWEKVDIRGPNECWLWLAAVMSDGYGSIRHEGQSLLAHRVVWRLMHGAIPDGICVCHHCDVKLCCNPAHLFTGTRADNAADMKRKGRSLRGEKHPQSILTAKQVLRMRRDYAEGGVTMQELTECYGVSLTTVCDSINHKKWKHLR